jgi:CBS domain containing-hemolysin-like protein
MPLADSIFKNFTNGLVNFSIRRLFRKSSLLIVESDTFQYIFYLTYNRRICMSIEIMTWIGIALCLSQSGIFSGLNLAMMGIGRLRLEVEASTGDPRAERVLRLRENYNFTLTTILWGNVAVNTLLAILSNSVLAGLTAFLFSTFFITFFGEIIPQAYFSRHALKMASVLSPLFKFYQVILYPLARPSSKILD